MANIAQTTAPDANSFPFDLAPFGGGADLPFTAIPRARITFRDNLIVVPAKIATNTTSIETTCLLAANYAYILEYVYCNVVVNADLDDADHFADLGQIRYQLGDGVGTRALQMKSEGLTPTVLNGSSQKMWICEQCFPLPLFNVLGAAPQIVVGVYDTDAVNATVAGTYSFFAAFLQYDIEQVFKLGVNYPTPVQVR